MGLTLVTGASGFVGTHLIQEMRQRGLPVRGVSRQNKPGLMTIPSYGPSLDWTPYLADVDVVVHLAARVHVMRETAKDPLGEFRAANVGATLNLARQAARAGVRRFIFVSTIKVNGESTEPGRPFTADDPPNPQDPYAQSKAEAEAALLKIGEGTGLEVVIIRPPLVYGRRVGGNFRSLMNWAAAGRPSLFSAVNNLRSLLYVGNLSDFIVHAIHHPQAAHRVFQVSDREALSTHQMIHDLTVAFGKKPKQLFVPLPILRTVAAVTGRGRELDRLVASLEVDGSRIGQDLSWVPPFTWSDALRATVADMSASKCD